MAKNATFKNLIAYEAREKFAAIIRPQKMLKQWEAAFDAQCNFVECNFPEPATNLQDKHITEQAIKTRG